MCYTVLCGTVICVRTPLSHPSAGYFWFYDCSGNTRAAELRWTKYELSPLIFVGQYQQWLAEEQHKDRGGTMIFQAWRGQTRTRDRQKKAHSHVVQFLPTKCFGSQNVTWIQKAKGKNCGRKIHLLIIEIAYGLGALNVRRINGAVGRYVCCDLSLSSKHQLLATLTWVKMSCKWSFNVWPSMALLQYIH